MAKMAADVEGPAAGVRRVASGMLSAMSSMRKVSTIEGFPGLASIHSCSSVHRVPCHRDSAPSRSGPGPSRCRDDRPPVGRDISQQHRGL